MNKNEVKEFYNNMDINEVRKYYIEIWKQTFEELNELTEFISYLGD